MFGPAGGPPFRITDLGQQIGGKMIEAAEREKQATKDREEAEAAEGE